jgi:hypothetical protein
MSTALNQVRVALGDRIAADQGDRLMARCPAHDDHTASLSITATNDRVLLNCHAGCSTSDVARLLGLTMANLFDDRAAPGGRNVVTAYDYTDAAGALLYRKVRYFPKAFRIQFWDGSGWAHRSKDLDREVQWVLYRLPRVQDAIHRELSILIVEGEKDVESLERHGFVATCNAHGAATEGQRAKWGARETAQLEGATKVAILPDNDAAGEAHARAICRSLLALPAPPAIRMVRLPDLPSKGDVSDWFERGGTAEQLRQLIRDTEPEATAESLSTEQPTRGASGRFKLMCAADVPSERVSWLWPDWLPFGKLVSVDGVAGVGKSTLLVDLIARATRGGPMPYCDHRIEPVTVLMAGVEDGWGDTIRPRLESADAWLERVHFVMPDAGKNFTVPRDVPALIEEAKKRGATWLHIETIMGVLDEGVSANSDHEVRRALSPLAAAAADARMLVTFIRHPRKSGGTAVNAGGGSVAFTALARLGLYVGWHPDDGELTRHDARRVLAVGKTNIGKHPTSLAFAVINSALANGAAAISWRDTCNVTADELAAPPRESRDRGDKPHKTPAREKERAWLRAQLDGQGNVRCDDLKAAARRDGLDWNRVHRAAKDEGASQLRIRAYPSHTVWYLP